MSEHSIKALRRTRTIELPAHWERARKLYGSPGALGGTKILVPPRQKGTQNFGTPGAVGGTKILSSLFGRNLLRVILE